MTRLVFLNILLGMFLTLSSVQASPYLYQIRIESHHQHAPAQARSNQLQAQGVSPVHEVCSVTSHTVVLGTFDYFMDAHLVLADLEQDGLTTGAVIVRTERESQTPPSSGAAGITRHKIFDKVEGDATLTTRTLSEIDEDLVEIQSVMASGTTQQIETALTQKIAQRSDSDPVKGRLKKHLAYIQYRKGDKEACRQIFQNLAEGQTAATPDDRLEAMIRIAHMIHGAGNRVDAYRAYQEIYDDSPTSSTKRAHAIQELSGLMMELARSEKGTLSETRAYYGEQLNTIPEHWVYTRALIELMHLESWFYDGNFTQVVQEGEAYLAQWGDHPDVPKRLPVTARYSLALAYEKVGRYNDAIQTLEAVLPLQLEPTDKWKHIPNLKIHALGWLKTIAERNGNAEQAAQYQQMLDNQ